MLKAGIPVIHDKTVLQKDAAEDAQIIKCAKDLYEIRKE